MPKLVASSYLGLGVEVTRGSAVSPAFYIPDMDPQWDPDLKWLTDKGYRGSPSENYDQVPGNRYDKFTHKGNIFVDSFPNYLRAILGGTDSVSTGGPTYTHSIKLLNDNSVASQPPSYTIVDFDGIYPRQLTGSQASKLEITAAADGECTYTMDWISEIETNVMAPTESYSAIHEIPGWDIAFTLGTAQSFTLMSETITIDRKAEPIFVAGQQGPYVNFAGPIEVTGKMTFVCEQNDLTIVDGLERLQQTVIFTFTEPITGYTIAMTMHAAQIENPKVIRSGHPFVTCEADFSAVANTTDAVTGYSPIETLTTNGTSSAY